MTTAINSGQAQTVSFQLATLHERHQAPGARHPLELTGVIGDGYLLHLFPEFVHVRTALAELDYRFVPAHEVFGLNSIFPTLELVNILETRAIPYRKTADAIQYFLSRSPNIGFDEQTFGELCVSNFTYHEGIHAIFYEIACALEGVPRGLRLVEVLLASEAMAMAFDQYIALIASAHAGSAIPVLLSLNSYSKPLSYLTEDQQLAPDVLRLRELAIDSPKQVICFFACAYLISLMRPLVNAGKSELVEWFVAYSGLVLQKPGDATLLLSIGLQVDSVFRGETQRRFYRLLGIEQEYEMALAAPLASNFQGNAALHVLMPYAVATIIDGTLPAMEKSEKCRQNQTISFFH